MPHVSLQRAWEPTSAFLTIPAAQGAAIAPPAFARLHAHADLAGTAASTLCLLHCLLTPVAIAFFPGFVQYLPGDTAFHRILAFAILLLGTAAFLPGFRLHRRKALLAPVALGIVLIVFVAWNAPSLSPPVELGCSVAGSLLLVAAHLLNRTFCRQCRACAHSAEPCHTTNLS